MSNKLKFEFRNELKPTAGKPKALMYGITIGVFLIISIVIIVFKEHLFLLWLTFVWRVVVIIMSHAPKSWLGRSLEV